MMENRSFDHYLGWLPGRRRPPGRASLHRRRGQTPCHAPAGARLPGLRASRPRPLVGRRARPVNGGAMDGFLRSGDNDEFSIGYYAEDDLPLHPGRGAGVHHLRPLLLLAARLDLPQPRVHARGAVLREDATTRCPTARGLPRHDDLRRAGRPRGSTRATSTTSGAASSTTWRRPPRWRFAPFLFRPFFWALVISVPAVAVSRTRRARLVPPAACSPASRSSSSSSTASGCRR